MAVHTPKNRFVTRFQVTNRHARFAREVRFAHFARARPRTK